MSGPVASYSITQTAAQAAFNVPFGLVTLVTTAIDDATAAGAFNVTVDCSLFNVDDVSNFRIYLNSLGYLVDFGRESRSLNIAWATAAPESSSDGTTSVDIVAAPSIGTWNYYAGVSGTVMVGAGQRVLAVCAYSLAGGTVVINGGDTIPVPPGVACNLTPVGNVTAPTVVFTSTDSYFIEVVG